MLIAYVDESYNQDFYFIGAAVTTQEKWEQLEKAYAALRTQIAADHGVPADVEFHGHELMGGAGEWSPLRGKHREAAESMRAALRIAQDAEVRYLFRGRGREPPEHSIQISRPAPQGRLAAST